MGRARATPPGMYKLLIFILMLVAGLGPLCGSRAIGQERGPSQTLQVDVALVLLDVTVTDRDKKYVTGLRKEDFQVWEDKIEHQLQYFSSETVPSSIAIVFDISGSMENKLQKARVAANTFLSIGDRDDEYLLIEFADSPRLVQDFTSDVTKLQSHFLVTGAKGNTSLYDALYLGLERAGRGRNARKALLVITDGEDNHSRYSLRDVREYAKEHDVMIYGIGIEDLLDTQVQSPGGRSVLQSLAELTGGAAFFPHSVDALPEICAQIAVDLKNQYVLGYQSANLANDGKWRKIRVKVNRPKGQSPVTVRTRTGYYAAALARAGK